MDIEQYKLAIQWYIRMRSPDVLNEEQQAHEDWLSQSVANKEAYEAIEREWQDLDPLSSWAIHEMRALEDHISPPRNNRYFLFGITSLVTAALVALVIYIYLPLVNQPEIHHYETMKGEQRKIVLEDGSLIHLNSASSLDVQYTSEVREINMLRGEGLFAVANERSRPFVVKVHESKIVAVGTRFSVYYKKNEVAVTVLEGRIAIMAENKNKEFSSTSAEINLTNSSILLESDRQARVNKQGHVSDVHIVDAEKITAWNRGLIIFDNTPLREVAEEISRYIVGQIQVAHDVPNYPVTGVIKIRDQETMLHLLSEVVAVTPVKQSSQLTMLYPSTKESTLRRQE